MFLLNCGVNNFGENVTHFFLPLIVCEGDTEKNAVMFLLYTKINSEMGEQEVVAWSDYSVCYGFGRK